MNNISKWVFKNKRNIGIAIMVANQGLKVFFPDLMTPEQSNWINGVGLTIAGTGLVHHGINNAKSVQNNKK